MELIWNLVSDIVIFCVAATFLLLGYCGARVVLRRYKNGENILATPAGEKELLFTLMCIMLGVVGMSSLFF
jgi:hypothetical protein